MRNVTRALVGAIVATLVAAAVSVYAQTPTAADFAVCNADAQVAVKAGTATPTTKDYVRVESARTDSAATWTTWMGPRRRCLSTARSVDLTRWHRSHKPWGLPEAQPAPWREA